MDKGKDSGFPFFVPQKKGMPGCLAVWLFPPDGVFPAKPKEKRKEL